NINQAFLIAGQIRGQAGVLSGHHTLIRELMGASTTMRYSGKAHHTGSNTSQCDSQTTRKYTCMLCCKSFNSGSSLSRHKKIHTGEKPFICPYCNKSFRQKPHLQYHIKGKH
ncbi:unnamed protein product, partial [Owenia fusiformis]